MKYVLSNERQPGDRINGISADLVVRIMFWIFTHYKSDSTKYQPLSPFNLHFVSINGEGSLFGILGLKNVVSVLHSKFRSILAQNIIYLRFILKSIFCFRNIVLSI
jgi:hypothetical protein